MNRLLLAAPLLFAAAACSAQTATNAATPAASAKPFTVAERGSFDEPFALAFLPDGRLLVTEKAGKLELRGVDGQVRAVSGVPAVAAGGQGGLLDVALAPDFQTSRTIYLSYSEPRPGGSSLALARATLDAGTPALQNLKVIFRAGSDGQGGQFGAVIAFAPDGKSLFLASGERQRFTPAQDSNQALGKILHLTLDGQPVPDNPNFGKQGAATVPVFDPPGNSVEAASTKGTMRPVGASVSPPAATWSSGHRNPYGLAFDPQGRLWEVEMGPKGGDEVNLIEKGGNYGWPKASNGDNYDGVPIPDHRPGDGFVAPKLYWNPSISPGGFLIYSGNRYPGWNGSGLIAALSAEALIRVTLGDAPAKANQWDMGTRIRDVAQAPDGTVWLLEDGGKGAGGRLLQLVPAGG